MTFAPDGAYERRRPGVVQSWRPDWHRDATRLTTCGRPARNWWRRSPRATRGSVEPTSFRNTSVAGRRGLQTSVVNILDGTGQREVIQIVTAQLSDGNLLYVIAVAPEEQVRGYQAVFQKVVDSIRLHE